MKDFKTQHHILCTKFDVHHTAVWLAALLLCVSATFNVCYATDSNDYAENQLIQQAESLQLANHPRWIGLLHYKQINNQYRSKVISPDFFLSPHGATNPAEELRATLHAFFKPRGVSPDEHAQCRFIARYQWLRQTLDWSQIEITEISCPQFDKWSLQGKISSISLVFATGYFGNPASFYGHILLKFNSDRNHIVSDLLDQSINYGAIIPDNENALVYVIKGIFGGYDAGFSSNQFYRHNHNYGENELRDMWEYQLALTKDEVDFLIAHSWELLGNRFVYYFVNENCSYQMAELLQLVIQQPLLPNLPWSQPGSLFDKLVDIQRNGEPVVTKVHRIPSRQNRFYHRFAALDDDLKDITRVLANNDVNLGEEKYNSLSSAQQISVLNTLLDYLEFRIASEDDDTQFAYRKKELLVERLRLPVETQNDDNQIYNAAPPHYGPRPNMVRTGILRNSELGNGIALQIRPAYFDYLSLDAGRLANSHLTMFDMKAMYTNDYSWLRSLDLVRVESLNVSQTGLPGDGGLAWKIKFGLDSVNLGCDDCLVFQVTGGLGKAYTVTPHTVLYYMLDLRAQTTQDNLGNYSSTAGLGLMTSPTPGWKAYLYYGHEQYLDGSKSHSPLATFQNRFGSSRDWDIRLSYEDHVDSEINLALSLYW